MGLREDAIAAAGAVRQERIDGARDRLATVLAPAPVTDLEVAAELSTQVVFTDDTICLSVADVDGSVSLVSCGQDGQWSFQGVVRDLARLGVLLGGTAGR